MKEPIYSTSLNMSLFRSNEDVSDDSDTTCFRYRCAFKKPQLASIPTMLGQTFDIRLLEDTKMRGNRFQKLTVVARDT